ncbi:MAG TPA: 16S rRNA (guanine(527)-N(7))-methyltransferase RsmG [Gammaproteobacteria bacterium]|nr:16S rRNA (guanine(527)-N(7))-methyltransferase RsmG [Gammaproteobacteria bacterium]
MSSDPLQTAVSRGCHQLDPTLDDSAVERFTALLRLLEKWNRVTNLTAVRDPLEMVNRHILDSLAVLPFLRGHSLLDVGTGAGLPGLPIAIARPGLEVTLLDANAKKVRFVRQAVAELGLEKVRVVQSRMQEYQPGRSFDMVISRAVASLDALYRQSVHLLRPGGRMLFMKGAVPEQEMDALQENRADLHIERLNVPGLAADRHLLWLETTGESSVSA